MSYGGDFTVYNIYSSNMVFQRGRNIVFAGTADADAAVTVTFNGNSSTVYASEDRVWSAEFPPMEYGGPYLCTIECADCKVMFDNIMIGEVWFCSGQSNMEMPVYSESPYWRTANAEKELENADHPDIRLFNASNYRCVSDDVPLDDVKGGSWQMCSAKTVADFSACAYFFGLRLAKELNVTIGLISSSWGGSHIEPWISNEVYKAHDWHFPAADERILQAQWEKLCTDELLDWAEKFDAFCSMPPADTVPDGTWEKSEDAFVNLHKRGRYLCSVEFELPESFFNKELFIEIANVNDADTTFFNAVKVGATGLERYNCWEAIRSYKVPASAVRKGLNRLLICADNHGSTGWAVLQDFKIRCGGEVVMPELTVYSKLWKALPENFPPRPSPPVVRGFLRGKETPSTLYNAMVHPWKKLAVAGVIWYQGCSNNGMTTYFEFQKMLVESMRSNWGEPELPFLLVQLAAFAVHDPENPMTEAHADALPVMQHSPYALVREIQAAVPRVMKNVGMVTAFDRGDHSDVHPRDKQTVGMRLAFKALKTVYGRDVVCDGPEFDGMKIEESRVRVFFKNADGGLTTLRGYSPIGFYIGDSDGAFYPAEAVIEGNTVVLYSPDVLYPQTVRYAYTGYCRVNLTNIDGWPAIPFRSDEPDYTRIFR